MFNSGSLRILWFCNMEALRWQCQYSDLLVCWTVCSELAEEALVVEKQCPSVGLLCSLG